MKEIHDRMPVILNKEARYKWLDTDLKDVSDLKQLLLPYPSEEMGAYKISTYMNSPKNNSPMYIHQVN